MVGDVLVVIAKNVATGKQRWAGSALQPLGTLDALVVVYVFVRVAIPCSTCLVLTELVYSYSVQFFVKTVLRFVRSLAATPRNTHALNRTVAVTARRRDVVYRTRIGSGSRTYVFKLGSSVRVFLSLSLSSFRSPPN